MQPMQDPYASAVTGLLAVNFEGSEPWLDWGAKECAAIGAMFGECDVVDDGVDGDFTDRQSNVKGGRLLFVLSQSKANPYRFSRVRAFNGSYMPVIPLALLKDHFCANLPALLTHIRQNVLVAPNAWVAGAAPGNCDLVDLWREAPHQNWSGTLPERKISAGEAAFFKARRATLTQTYAMNEWQVRTAHGAFACRFDGKLVDDPGALRIVSVTGRRTLTASNFSYVPPVGQALEPGFRGKIDDSKAPTRLQKNFNDAGDVYTREQVRGVTTTSYKNVTKERPHGVPDNVKAKSPAAKFFTVELHARKPVRFYFSMNHYRPIVFNVKSSTIELNPWFMIVDD